MPVTAFERPKGNSGGTAENTFFRPESQFSQGVFILKEGDSSGSDKISKFHNRIHFRRFTYQMKVD